MVGEEIEISVELLRRVGESMRAMFTGTEFHFTVQGEEELRELELGCQLFGEVSGIQSKVEATIIPGAEFTEAGVNASVHYWKKEEGFQVEADHVSDASLVVVNLSDIGVEMLKRREAVYGVLPRPSDSKFRIGYSNR